MHGEWTIPLATLYAFLLVLARISGALVFVPLPGINRGPEASRVALALGFTMLLVPQWPRIETLPHPGQLAGWLVAEAGFGLMVGLAVAFLTEAFVVAAQVMGLPAGYAYASVVDPRTQADSGVLLVLAQLTGGMVFFALGFDRAILRIFADSLAAHPPGSLALAKEWAETVIRLGSGMFSTGLRLAMPALALLVLVDIALALVGRLNAQLQLLTLAFPIKMMAAVMVLFWTAALFPRVYAGYGQQAVGVLRRLAAGGG